MKRKQITFVPVGGLANRMKAVDAAISLAKDVGSSIEVIWFPDWGLKCRFDQLFMPIEEGDIVVKEATNIDYLLNDRPRRKNLYLPRLAQQVKFDACIYEQEAVKLHDEGGDFRQYATNKHLFMASYFHFYGEEPVYYPRFAPTQELQQRIAAISSSFGEQTIGIHIRRTDNIRSIQESPTQLFVARMRREIEKNPRLRFYLATDSDIDKQLLIEEFGERIITSSYKVNRDSVRGIQDALVEMYALSKCQYIFGSFYSTFSQVAALIGNITCEVIKR